MNTAINAAKWIRANLQDARDVWCNGGRPVRHNESGSTPRKATIARAFDGPGALRRLAKRVRNRAHRHNDQASFWLASALEMEAEAWGAAERGSLTYAQLRLDADRMFDAMMEVCQ